MSRTGVEQQECYIELLEESLGLIRQKEVYMQQVINDYGSHKVDRYLKKIKELEEKIIGRMAKMKKIRHP